MKSKSIKLIIFAVLVLMFSCEKPERNNPWDEKANINPSAWAPQNLQIEDVSITEKKLTWTYNGDDRFEGFKLDRKKGNESWQVAYQTFPKETRNWNDSEIIPDPDLTYAYRIYAYAGRHNSAEQFVSTSGEITAPTILQITNNSITSVTLNWQDNSTGEDGFKIERKYEGGDWTQLATIATNNYEDNDFDLNTWVYYRVCAFVETYNSSWVENNFDATIPPLEDFNISANSATSVTLTWEYSHTGHEGFKIGRKVNEGNWELAFATLNAVQTAFSDNGLDLNSNVYYYRVFVYNNQYESVKIENLVSLQCGNPFPDIRDGNSYETVQIDSQCWMKENLAYLPSVSPSSNSSETEPYYYVYAYEGTNVTQAKATSHYQTYGVLYNWPASLNACPDGWHLPTDDEWTVLTDYLGGENIAGGKMKEIGTTYWNTPNTGATNSSSFTGLPGGNRYINGSFYNQGNSEPWWSSSESDATSAWYRGLGYSGAAVSRCYFNKSHGYAVRCLKDN